MAVGEIGTQAEYAGKTVNDAAAGMSGDLDDVAKKADEAADKIGGIAQKAAQAPSTEFPWDKVLGAILGGVPISADDIDAIMTGGGNAIANRFMDRAGQLHRDAMTPLEQYNEKMDELDRLAQMQLITMEDRARLEEKYWRDVNDGADEHLRKLSAIEATQRAAAGADKLAWLDNLAAANMPSGGFVGGSMPANFRFFSDPATSAMQGGRSVYSAADLMAQADQAYADLQAGQGDPQLDEANQYLSQIAENTADMGMRA